jgi:hypothetical protein
MPPWRPLSDGIIEFPGPGSITQISVQKYSFKKNWLDAWHSPDFRWKLLAGLLLLILIFSLFPWFFQTIEKRKGVVMNDWILEQIHPVNVSVPIFLFIWSTTLLLLVRCIQHPDIFLSILWGYSLVCLSRVCTISLVPLDPPAGLLELTDRMGNAFYGSRFITRDLFYSGHTASVFVFYLCLKKKSDRAYALTATIIVGALLLVQHVHYTIDVVAAPFFCFCMYRVSTNILKPRWAGTVPQP